MPLEEALEGKYEILEQIGEGGLGAVYKVRHRLLDEIRVIKVLRQQVAQRRELRQRFLQEARLAIRLKHANIARMHDFAVAPDGTSYLVMEYIDGVGIHQMLRLSGPPGVGLAVEISLQALDALHYLHESGFLHRDVSPDNLMVTTGFDGRPLVKLIDLGIARRVGNDEQRLTATGVFLGKVRYTAPEQFSAGEGRRAELDRRSDVYSYGVVLYEMLTGVYPFEGASFAEIATSHLFQPPRDFALTDPEARIPLGVRKVVLRALGKGRAERWQDAAQFADALREFAEPDDAYRSEFGRTYEMTAAALPQPRDYSAPGSTQERLDREFELAATTPAPAAPPEQRRERPAADRPERQRPRARVRLLAAAGALALAAAAAVTWYLLGGRAPDRLANAELPSPPPGAILFDAEASRRWDAAAVEAPFVAWSDPAGLAPPLSEEEQAAARAAARPRPEPPTPADEPEEAVVIEAPAEAEPPLEPEPAPPEPDRVETVFEPAVGVVPPVQLTAGRPPYPEKLKRRKEPVEVVVGVLVDEYGRVIDTDVRRGRRAFRPHAVAAARRVEFRPASRGGVLGRMWTEVRIVFDPEAD